jgi:hypothetical protein
VAGRRRYRPESVRTLTVIDTAQRAGLALDDITLLLEASSADGAATDRLRVLAEQRLPELVALIERAEVVRGWLEDAARCVCPTLDDCPLFEPERLPERDDATPTSRAVARPAARPARSRRRRERPSPR